MANDFLAGTAFVDSNNNGSFDTNENYLVGATIELRTADGLTTIATDTTDGFGGYLFDGLLPGNYKLVNLSASGYVPSSANPNSQISPVTATSTNSINVTLLDPADLKVTIDIPGYFAAGNWRDMNYVIFGQPVNGSGGQMPATVQGTGLSPSPSNPYWTYCVDLFNDLISGINGPFSVIADSVPQGGGSPHNAGRVAYLYNHYGQVPQGAVKAAATQAAIWELLYDSDDNLATGNFQLTSAPADVVTEAINLLAESSTKSEYAIFLNVPPPAPQTVTVTQTQGTIVSGSFNFGNVQTASLGDFVWDDKNANGVQDPLEPGIGGVQVTITGPNSFTQTVTTSAAGAYAFTGLVPGTYSVSFATPAGYVVTNANQGGDDTKDSDGLTVSGITLASGEDNPTIDQGFYKLASLGDFVWDDKNANGIQDPLEPGIGGVQVTITGPNSFTQTVTTSAAGAYAFTGLVPGTYSVSFATPAGYVVTTANQGGDDAKDSDGLTVSGITLASGEDNPTIDQGFYMLASLGDFVWDDLNANGIQDPLEPGIAGVTVTLLQNGNPVGVPDVTDSNGAYGFANLVPGTYSVVFSTPAGYSISTANVGGDDTKDSDGTTVSGIVLDSGENDPTIDQGFYKLASLGDFVWDDLNANGVQDSGEPGIGNVPVTITGPNSFSQTVNTNASGFYQFTNLVPGTYSVSFGSPAGYVVTTSNVPGDDTKDSDGLIVTNIVLNSGDSNQTIDQGFYKLASLGNFVWNDLDTDGIQDANEPGIPGIKIQLLKDGNPVGAAVTTDANGFYAFTDLVPGNYSVQFSTNATYPQVSPANQGNDDTVDSDGLLTQTVTLISGENNTTLDQGLYAQGPRDVCLPIDMQGNSSIYGTAGNIRTFSSGGVSVKASAFSRTSAGAWATAYLGAFGGGLGVTDGSEDGQGDTHTVDNIGRLNYVLFEFSQPVVVDSAFLGYVVGDSDMTVWIGNATNPFTNHQTLSDAFLTGLFTETNFTTSTSARLADINGGARLGNILVIAAQVDDTSPEDRFKIQTLNLCVPGGTPQTASLGDFVWHDVNGNGTQDGSEAGIPGATVTLVGGGADGLINGVGDTTTVTTTDATGKYAFANLTPGTAYQVTFSLPSGFDSVTGRKVGGNAATDSDGLVSDVIVLSGGENNTTLDAGFVKYAKVGNFVWKDLNQNGLQDSGEPGIPGVQLTLTGTTSSGASVSQSTTTSSNGSYLFSTLPGTYTVSIAASNFTTGGALVGFTASPTNIGADRSIDSNVTPSGTTPATLASAGSDLTLDFGYYASTTQVCVSFNLEGGTSNGSSYGNIRSYSASNISLKASAFSRDSGGSWATAYLGSYSGGLGVTDSSEGNGSNNTHTVDNVGRMNYILFEFSQPVLVDSAFLGYVVGDSDLTAWIGTVNDPYNNHRTLSDSFLSSLGSEANDTTLTTTRTANLNASGVYGNVLVIAASISDTTPDDWFKVAELSLCANIPTTSTPTKFFVADDDLNKTFKYTSTVQYTSNFAVAPTNPMGIAANPNGSNVWVADLNGRIYKYDSNGTAINNWNTGVSRIQGVSTNGTSIWTVSDHTDRVYFYSGAASFTPSNYKPNPTLTSSFGLHYANTNPTDLATDGTYVWVVNEGNISGGTGDMIYKYTVSGSYLGRWQLDSRNSRPTGITIDPNGGSKIWVVDNGNDTVFEYSGATGCVSGGLVAAKTYALHSSNTNPQGIADPPGAEDAMDLIESKPASLLTDGSFVNPDVNPFYNTIKATDVNDDGVLTALDALTVINRLNTRGSVKLTNEDFNSGDRWSYEDVNGDGIVSPIDALFVINELNLGSSARSTVAPAELPEEMPSSEAAADQFFGDMATEAEGEMSAAS